MKLGDIPKRLLVIGGGYIGLEMGSVYNALGTQVTVVEFMPSLLPGADEDLVRPLARKLKKAFENGEIKEPDQIKHILIESPQLAKFIVDN